MRTSARTIDIAREHEAHCDLPLARPCCVRRRNEHRKHPRAYARATGKGQVVDAAMADSAAYLMSMFHGMAKAGTWRTERASNMIDGGAPFYNVYRCADGEWIAIGAIEPQFYASLLDKIGALSEGAGH